MNSSEFENATAWRGFVRFFAAIAFLAGLFLDAVVLGGLCTFAGVHDPIHNPLRQSLSIGLLIGTVLAVSGPLLWSGRFSLQTLLLVVALSAVVASFPYVLL